MIPSLVPILSLFFSTFSDLIVGVTPGSNPAVLAGAGELG